MVALQQAIAQSFEQSLVQELCGMCRNSFKTFEELFLKKSLQLPRTELS